MSTNYQKRKEKVEKELQDRREDIRSRADTSEPVVYTQSGVDVFSPDNGRSYKVAQISYNPETGHAKVTGTFDITRLVGLTYAAHKSNLNILKKKTR